uniref:Uncharacterized protein n=1 Tax=Rhizophagus irregularis (strain DAOM 181602 / DAOM 197198 / MUCL 43194) TaxID=747089 RepID=U9SJ40_RHIID
MSEKIVLTYEEPTNEFIEQFYEQFIGFEDTLLKKNYEQPSQKRNYPNFYFSFGTATSLSSPTALGRALRFWIIY